MPRRRFVSSGPKRQNQWVAPAAQAYLSVGSTNSVIIASFTPDAQGLNHPTVVRTRGQVSIKLPTYAADANVVGAFGVGIVTEQAFNAGQASIPETFDEADWGGWFVWRSFSLHYESITAASSFIASWEFEVDSKAMRKVGPNDTIVLMASSQVGAFDISMPLRMLLKLS